MKRKIEYKKPYFDNRGMNVEMMLWRLKAHQRNLYIQGFSYLGLLNSDATS